MFLFSFTTVLIVILLVYNVAVVAAAGEYNKNSCYSGEHTILNPSPDPDTISPEIWYFHIPTTVTGNGINIVGDNGNNMIVIEIHREWSPLGADRVYSLVKDNYYDCAAFFRVVPGFMVQWGIASNPTETEKWKTPIQDDPVLESISNTMGMVSYAKTGPNSRTRQIFVNTVDNTFLDAQGFTPFGKVVKGMDILASMYVPTPVPSQPSYIRDGNTWILQEYPEIDIIQFSEQKIFFALDDTMETDDNISGSSRSMYSSIMTTLTVVTFTSFVALLYML
mmetsp:Transcript_35938/g.40036  ORF Transcript_35938/g.40036 Transcript_35938/m.40036 type:complete len:279 (-) Transcript_35938:367-1203(-)